MALEYREKRLDIRAKTEYNYTILKISFGFKPYAERSTQNITIFHKIVFHRSITQKTPTNPHSERVQRAKLKKLKKNENYVTFPRPT